MADTGARSAVERFRVSHPGADLTAMCRRLRRSRVRRVAIERPDGPVVDALMGAGLEVVVIASRQVKALRERDGSTGNEDDALATHVLADVLRTDGGRLRALSPDSPATLTLRLACRLKACGYRGRRSAGELYRRLADAPAGPVGEGGRARGAVSDALVAVLVRVREQIAALEARIAEADGQIFTSLPRSGTVRAANLLAEIGDCPERVPTAESLACLAGAAPATRSSGKHRAVTFRRAADKRLRDALIDFAGDSRHANAWAADLDARARARGTTNPHSEGILARSWCGVIWRSWQDRVPYDPARHGALQRLVEVGGRHRATHAGTSLRRTAVRTARPPSVSE